MLYRKGLQKRLRPNLFHSFQTIMPLRGISSLTPSNNHKRILLAWKGLVCCYSPCLGYFKLSRLLFTSVNLFPFLLKLEFCYGFFFFHPKYESASKCNATDVGETSGIGTSPTSSLVGIIHCNGCFRMECGSNSGKAWDFEVLNRV